MILQFASDLHLEMPLNMAYIQKSPLIPSADILILAGDITYLNDSNLGDSVFDQWSKDFKEVYIVPGNHEFYAKYFPISDAFPTLKKEVKSNVYYLNNQTILFDKVRILFTTLFSHIPSEKAALVKGYINDFYGTRFERDSMKPLTLEQFNQCHIDCVHYLKSELEKPFDGTTIIVSHFAPFNKKWIPQYPQFPLDLSSFFHAELEWMCEQYAIDHWISGHTHISFDSFQIGNTWMHCNMLGYVANDEYAKFRRDQIINT
ncbi:MAG: metallophosphoesterase [Cyclobacteriaceae bacterium]